MAKAATATAPKVRPLGDKVLVKRDTAETRTESGLYLPETAKDKPKSGTVTAVGPGAINTDTGERIPMTLKTGDKVLFTSYAGTEIKLDGMDLLILDEHDILAIVD